MIVLNGGARETREGAFLGASILGRTIPEAELPYLFCGNGSCRDCNALIEGLPDLPACRIPACRGLSIRTGEEDGSENALSLALGETQGDSISADVLVVGAGPAGLAAAEAVQEEGRDALVLEARQVRDLRIGNVLPRSPVLVREGQLFVFRAGIMHKATARAVVVATGASDRIPTFPGSTLPGVFPCDLAERYLARDFLPGTRFLVDAPAPRRRSLVAALFGLGAAAAREVPEQMILASISGTHRVERASLVAANPDHRDVEMHVAVDTVLVAGRRLPSIGLARALGCESAYDRTLGGDRIVAMPEGVFVAGDALSPGTVEEARESGRRAGKSACTSRRSML